MKKATFKISEFEFKNAQCPDDLMLYYYLKEALASLGADWALNVEITDDGRKYTVSMEE